MVISDFPAVRCKMVKFHRPITRKLLMLRRYVLLLVGLAVLSCVLSSSFAQAPHSPGPAELLESARLKNGLTGADVRPWHIHGNYKIYNETGQAEVEGTYEEWWLSPTRYKLSFANSH